MIVVSKDFKNAMKQPVKELDGYIKLDNQTKITSADDLISFKISCDTSMCKTAMRKLEGKYLGEHNLLGKWVHVGFGVKISNGRFEYLDYGSFLITEITTTKDTGVTQIIGYDKMINSMTKYDKLDVIYPINLYDYAKSLCENCGLELGNDTFIHNNWMINYELWENIEGITYRDILVQIAQATASTCIISNDDKVYFKYLTDTKEELTYDNMKKLKLEPIYGEINSVVLSRTPQEDNIYMSDDESIENNGLTEFKIENNEIIDKDRDNAMQPIYDVLHGISYYPFETTTEGLGWYEIADSFNIKNNIGEMFNTSLFNFSITIDGGIKEILKTVADTKTQTQYQYATTVSKRVNQAYLMVDKQNIEISSLTSKVDTYDTRINNNYQELLTKFDNYTPSSKTIEIEKSVTQLQTNTYTKFQIDTKLVDGSVEKVKSEVILLDDEGITVDKNDSPVKTNLDADGFEIIDKSGSTDETLLEAKYDKNLGETIVRSKNIKVEKYLTIGTHSRIEDYEDGTGIFYLG